MCTSRIRKIEAQLFLQQFEHLQSTEKMYRCQIFIGKLESLQLTWLSSSSFERFIDLSFLRFDDTEYPTTVGSSSMYSSYVDTGAINGAFNDPAKMIGLHYAP